MNFQIFPILNPCLSNNAGSTCTHCLTLSCVSYLERFPNPLHKDGEHLLWHTESEIHFVVYSSTRQTWYQKHLSPYQPQACNNAFNDLGVSPYTGKCVISMKIHLSLELSVIQEMLHVLGGRRCYARISVWEEACETSSYCRDRAPCASPDSRMLISYWSWGMPIHYDTISLSIHLQRTTSNNLSPFNF